MSASNKDSPQKSEPVDPNLQFDHWKLNKAGANCKCSKKETSGCSSCFGTGLKRPYISRPAFVAEELDRRETISHPDMGLMDSGNSLTVFSDAENLAPGDVLVDGNYFLWKVYEVRVRRKRKSATLSAFCRPLYRFEPLYQFFPAPSSSK